MEYVCVCVFIETAVHISVLKNEMEHFVIAHNQK